MIMLNGSRANMTKNLAIVLNIDKNFDKGVLVTSTVLSYSFPAAVHFE